MRLISYLSCPPDDAESNITIAWEISPPNLGAFLERYLCWASWWNVEAVFVGGDPVSNGHVVDALVGNLASQQLPHHNPITEKGEKTCILMASNIRTCIDSAVSQSETFLY